MYPVFCFQAVALRARAVQGYAFASAAARHRIKVVELNSCASSPAAAGFATLSIPHRAEELSEGEWN